MRLAVVEVGDSGVVYVVDRDNQYVLHSEMDFTLVGENDPLRDASQEPPVVAFRQGRVNELVIFTDSEGVRWWAYPTEMGMLNQGVVVQQQELVIAQDMQRFQTLAWVVIVIGAIMLLPWGF